MDPQIEELKELIRQNTAISQETNKMVHSMRTAGRLKSLFWFLVFLVSTGVSLYAYFYFVAPRVEQLKDLYEQSMGQTQSFQTSLDNLFKNFGSDSSTP